MLKATLTNHHLENCTTPSHNTTTDPITYTNQGYRPDKPVTPDSHDTITEQCYKQNQLRPSSNKNTINVSKWQLATVLEQHHNMQYYRITLDRWQHWIEKFSQLTNITPPESFSFFYLNHAMNLVHSAWIHCLFYLNYAMNLVLTCRNKFCLHLLTTVLWWGSTVLMADILHGYDGSETCGSDSNFLSCQSK